jgi:hypothetical protein
MSDTTEATAALDKVESLISEAREEQDPAQRLGKLPLVKECATQAVKFGRRAFLASAGFTSDPAQASLPLPGDEDKPRGHRA